MPDLGVRLQLLIGPTVPRPAPFVVMDALLDLEVTNKDREIDGFQIKFSLGKDSATNYGLLKGGLLDPPNRVIIVILMGVLPQVLLDGMITQHQIVPSNQPGETLLVVTGEDITRQLDLEEKKETFANQSDSAIVKKVLGAYATYGIQPQVTETKETPSESERVPTQQGTDLKFIRKLAKRNGFVFYIEPQVLPGFSTAYWGPDNRRGAAQPALTMNMGPQTNVDTPISISFNALGPETPQVTIIEPTTKLSIPVPLPNVLAPNLSSQPATSLRKTLPIDTANLNMIQAGLRALSASSESADAVVVTGEIDAVRYGQVLRSRRLVGLRGVGQSYNGAYYVQEVKHLIQRGQYKQTFTLTREGRGSSSATVTT